MQIAVCDEWLGIAGKIETFLYRMGNKQNMFVEFYKESNSMYREIKDGKYYDVIFLSLSIVEGIQRVIELRTAGNLKESLLICMGKTYFWDAKLFEAEPFRFLKKPLVEKEFCTVWRAVLERLQEKGKIFECQIARKTIRIPVSQIEGFMNHLRRVTIYTIHGEWSFYEHIEQLAQRLSIYAAPFVRIHKSFIINFDYVFQISAREVVMESGRVYPISNTYRKSVRKLYQTYSRLLG